MSIFFGNSISVPPNRDLKKVTQASESFTMLGSDTPRKSYIQIFFDFASFIISH